MSEDLSSEVSIKIDKEGVGRTISSLERLLSSITVQSEGENFEDLVGALKDEAARTQALLDKYNAASQSSTVDSLTITQEELRRSISALQLAFATASEEAERDNPSRPAQELTAEAEAARALIKKIRASV